MLQDLYKLPITYIIIIINNKGTNNILIPILSQVFLSYNREFKNKNNNNNNIESSNIYVIKLIIVLSTKFKHYVKKEVSNHEMFLHE